MPKLTSFVAGVISTQRVFLRRGSPKLISTALSSLTDPGAVLMHTTYRERCIHTYVEYSHSTSLGVHTCTVYTYVQFKHTVCICTRIQSVIFPEFRSGRYSISIQHTQICLLGLSGGYFLLDGYQPLPTSVGTFLGYYSTEKLTSLTCFLRCVRTPSPPPSPMLQSTTLIGPSASNSIVLTSVP